jgi:uncharacterized membrane protein
MKEDNTVFVLQKAIKTHRIKVANSSVKEFLLSHPRYPSLKSVCDGLSKWKINHYPLKLSKEEILDLEPPYIAHMGSANGQLAFVEKNKDSKITFFLNKKEMFVKSTTEFSANLSGGIIVLDPDKNSGETGYREKRDTKIIQSSLLPMLIITMILVGAYVLLSETVPSFYSSSNFPFLFVTKTIGITASIFLLLHEFKVHTSLSDKICGFSSGIDCDSVLSSDASRIFGNINLADAGIIYFTSTLIYVLSSGTPDQLWLLSAISAVSIVFPVYSIYYQGFRLKKWCSICLVVQVTLIAEFIILFPLLGLISITLVDILRLAAFFTLVTAIWILYKSYFELSGDFNHENYSYLRFKSNPGIFKFLLQENGYTDIPENSGSLVFGNPDAMVKVTAFLSLNCNPCANAFKEIKDLLENTNQVSVNVVLSINTDEKSKKLAGYIYKLYYEEGKEKVLEFMLWWYSRTREEKNVIINSVQGEFTEIEKTAKCNAELFEKVKIHGTPTIIVNGYRVPRQYKVNDIEYFIDDIKSLSMERKGQEACSHCR